MTQVKSVQSKIIDS